jgi:hypothetical protein
MAALIQIDPDDGFFQLIIFTAKPVHRIPESLEGIGQLS